VEFKIGISLGTECYSKVAGVTQKNADGSDRQRIVKSCRKGDGLRFVRDTTNTFDPNAVMIFTAKGAQLGFVTRQLATTLGPLLDRGGFIFGKVSEVTGGKADQSCGLNYHVAWGEQSQTSTIATTGPLPPPLPNTSMTLKTIATAVKARPSKQHINPTPNQQLTFIIVVATGVGVVLAIVLIWLLG